MVAACDPVLAVLGRGVVGWDSPVLHADDDGVTRGDGCFEGIRVVGGVATKLDRHLARMARSAGALGLAFDPDAWRSLVSQACARWPEDREGALKLVLTRGRAGAPTGYLTLLPTSFGALRASGISVITLQRGFAADAFADAPWLLGGVKTLSYAVNMAAAREAARRGADDVIFISRDGLVLEAPTASVVWADGRQLFSVPPGDNGILAGTTQQLLFDRAAQAGWQPSYAQLPAAALADVPAVWLTSSVRGPVEVVSIDGRARPAHPELTREIQRLAGF